MVMKEGQTGRNEGVVNLSGIIGHVLPLRMVKVIRTEVPVTKQGQHCQTSDRHLTIKGASTAARLPQFLAILGSGRCLVCLVLLLYLGNSLALEEYHVKL